MRFSFYLKIFTLLFLTIGALYSQQLKELTIEEMPPGESINYVVRTEDQSVFIAHTKITELSFESNMGIIEVKNPEPGEYWVYLNPGTNIITIKAGDYKSLRRRVYIREKEYVEYRVSEKVYSTAVENRPQVVLRYTPDSPDEQIIGAIDGRVMNLNFQNGQVTLRPKPGEHTIKLNSEGRVWEQSLTLEAGDQRDITVDFPNRKSEAVKMQETGGMYINSNPSGARVMMNQVEQGQTPLTLEDIPPGTYTIEVSKPLYLPSTATLEVKPLDYTTHEVELTPNFGSVEITTKPPGAAVYLNGAMRGETPYSLSQIDAGEYQVELRKKYYKELTDQFTIEPGDEFTETYTLEPQFGRVTFQSVPSGAEITVDGNFWGVTPVTKDTVVSGAHYVRVDKDFYNPYEERIQVLEEQTLERTFRLQPNFGTVQVYSTPPGATVTITGDTTVSVRTPTKQLKLPSGSYTITVEKENYELFETSQFVVVGADKVLEPELVRKTGNLRVSTTPQRAKIYVDGKQKGISPAVLKDILTGFHEIRIDKAGYDIVEQTVMIKHDVTQSLSQELSTVGTKVWRKKRKKARRLAIILPGAGQYASGQPTRGTIYSAGFVGSIAAAIHAIDAYYNSYSNYQDALQRYRNARSQSFINTYFEDSQTAATKMKNYNTLFTGALMTAGGIYLIQLTDALIWGGGPRPTTKSSAIQSNWHMAPALSPDGRVSLNLIWTFGDGL